MQPNLHTCVSSGPSAPIIVGVKAEISTFDVSAFVVSTAAISTKASCTGPCAAACRAAKSLRAIANLLLNSTLVMPQTLL